jgi:hypothetical protein
MAKRRGPGGGSGTLKRASLGLINGIPISGLATAGFAMPGFVVPGFAVAKLSGVGAAKTSSFGNKTVRPVRAKTIG